MSNFFLCYYRYYYLYIFPYSLYKKQYSYTKDHYSLLLESIIIIFNLLESLYLDLRNLLVGTSINIATFA